jgi:hypothetical protein
MNPTNKYWPPPDYWNDDRLAAFFSVEIERCRHRHPHRLVGHEIGTVLFTALYPDRIDGLAYPDRRDAAAAFGAAFATSPGFVCDLILEVRRRMARGSKRTWIRYWLDERLQWFEPSASDAELAAAMAEETGIAVTPDEVGEHRVAMR